MYKMSLLMAVLLSITLQAVACAADDTPSAITALRQSAALINMEHYDAALNTVNNALKADPGYLPLWRERGHILLLQKNYPEALTTLKQVITVNPKDPEANLLLFLVLAEAPATDIASAGLSLPAFLNKLDTPDIKAILTYLFENSKQTELLQTFANNWDPSEAQRKALSTIIKAYAAGNLQDAEKRLVGDKELTAAYGPTLARFVYLIGVGYRDSGRYDDALRAFQEAADMGHDAAEIQGDRGWVYFRKGDPAKALEIWEAHWREASNPGDWTLWIGNAAFAVKDYAKAAEFYQRALGFQPKNPVLQGKYLCSLLLAKEDDKATAYQNKLQSAGGNDSVAFGQALFAMTRNAPDDTLAALSHITQTLPFQEEITAMIRDIASRPGERAVVEKRARLIATLLHDSPAQASILRDVAWTLWNAGSMDAAISLWKQALDLGLADPDPLRRQVVLRLIEADKTAEALDFMKKQMPKVTPLGLVLTLNEQPDMAKRVLDTTTRSPANRGPWTALIAADTLLRTGDTPAALEQLQQLSRQTAPLPPLTVTGFDATGHAQPRHLTSQQALTLYLQIAQTLIAQDVASGFPFLKKPVWLPDLSPQASADLQAKAGAVAFRAGREAQGKDLCTAAVALDPGNALAAAYLFLTKPGLERSPAETQRLAQVLDKISPFDREYILGTLARQDRKPQEALEHLDRALALSPAEQGLRLDIIELLMDENRFADARDVQRWFEERLAQGDKTVRSAAAVTRTMLGEPEKALEIWKALLQQYPGSPEYLAGQGRALNLAKRYEETRATLHAPLRETHSPDLALIAAEADTALGAQDEALRDARLGLKKDPKDFQLLRSAAESADGIDNPEAATEYARRALAANPQSNSLIEILGRALLERKQYDDAKKLFQDTLQRNDEQEAALRGLLTIAQETDAVKDAYTTALALHKSQPADPGLALKYAIASAGDKRFSTAYDVLRPMADTSHGGGILSLYYPEILDTNAPGKVRLQQWQDHMRQLHERGVNFVTLADFRQRPDARELSLPDSAMADKPCAMILVGKAEQPVLERMDKTLKAVNGRALLVVDGASLAAGTPYSIDRQGIKALVATGRWSLVLTDGNPPTIPLQGGHQGNFWGHAMWLGHGLETDVQLRKRLDQRLRALRQAAGDLPITAWLYPGGLAPNDLLDVTPGQRQAYHDAVAENFPIAFTGSPEGFVAFMSDKGQLPVRFVSPGWDATMLNTHLDQRAPQHQAVFELAKATSWHEQLERADVLYAKAQPLGVNPGELAYHRSANALAEGDTPRAMTWAREAVSIDPDSEKYYQHLGRVERTTHPNVTPVYDLYWDSDNRTNSWLGLTGSLYARDDLMLSASVGNLSWTLSDHHKRNLLTQFVNRSLVAGEYSDTAWDNYIRAHSYSSLTGQEVSVGARWFSWADGWLEAKAAMTTLDSGQSPFFGGSLALHDGVSTELLRLNGTYDLRYAYERMDTIEAMNQEIRSHHATLETHFRALDFWEIWSNGNVQFNTDGNKSYMIDGRIMRRLLEKPQFSLGYAYQFGSSDRNPEQYWSPLNLATHLGYATLTYPITDWLTLNGYVGCGPSIARGTDWRFVTRTGTGLTLRITDSLRLVTQYSYYKTPTYELNHLKLAISYTF